MRRDDHSRAMQELVHYRSRRASRGVVLLGVTTSVIVLVAAVAWVATSLLAAPPRPRAEVTVASSRTVAGAPLVLDPPVGTQEAVALQGVGTIATAGTETPMPIASLTKMMSALVVLRDHPLALGSFGPEITVTVADVATYRTELAEGDSVVAVRAGEQLNELQALEGTLIPSGDNVVELLARWDAGSTAAFVAKMNRLARSLGMSSTHYAGPSGVDPATVSTASDQLRLAEVAMSNPLFRAIVGMPQAILPVAGVVYNVDADLGANGIDGIKTGWIPQSGGCFAFAAKSNRAVGSSIIGVVLGEQGATPIPTALATAEQVLLATRQVLTTMTIPAGSQVARIAAPYGRTVSVVTATALSLPAWQGATLHLSLRLPGVFANAIPAGETVGSLEVHLARTTHVVALRTTSSLSGPSFLWRLRHP